ncbi:MAG: ISKra4 family transposase [Devosia sp.]|nr:ISKra4 family transposase [Devosia sp.]
MKTGADGEEPLADVLKINRPDDLGDIANLGLTLAEGKLLLAGLQQKIVAAQAKDHAVRRPDCRSCGEVCSVKDYRDHVVATLFGQVTVRLPRFRCAGCGGNEAGHGWPSHCRSTPELDQLQAHLSALMTYRVAADVLEQMFPVGAGNDPETLRCHTLKIGADLRYQPAVRPDTAVPSITVTLDSTLIRSCEDGERHLEVRVGNVETETGGRQVFGAVAKADTDIKVLIRRSLDAVGRTEDTVLTAFTDGCSGLRRILADAGVTEAPMLDWFHIAMRLQHLEQTAGGLSADDPVRMAAKVVIVEEVERLHWRLWNGKAKDAQISIDRIRAVMHHFHGEQDQRRSIAPSRKLWTALRALDGYLTGQSDWLVNYAERHRAGLRVGTAITEGTANFLVNRRMNKSQQMRWSRRGADLLLQVRCAVYNGTLGSGFGQRFQPANDPLPQAPLPPDPQSPGSPYPVLDHSRPSSRVTGSVAIFQLSVAELSCRGVCGVLRLGVECDRRAGCRLVDYVHDRLEQRQAFGRQPEAAADHDAVISRARQLPLEHRAPGVIGGDHAGVALPAAFRDLGHGDGDAGVDLVGVEARRQRRVREVDGFRLLADEQDAGHAGAPCEASELASSKLLWLTS